MAGTFNARKVETLTKPGRYADKLNNLYLRITPDGGKRWTFFYRWQGKRKDMGLGSAGKGQVSLGLARDKAADAFKLLSSGVDPHTVMGKKARDRAETPIPAFGDFANDYLASHEGKWRNDKHRAQWRMTLETYAAPLRALPVNAIGTDDVLAVLQPLWSTIPETAARLRGRIEAVLDAAKAKGHRTAENPARWRGHLQTLLPARQRLTRGHHAALAYDDLPAFLAALRSRQALAARALEFLIFTAARSGEVLGAKWTEIDMDKALWVIPRARMKGGAGTPHPALRRGAGHPQALVGRPHRRTRVPRQPARQTALGNVYGDAASPDAAPRYHPARLPLRLPRLGGGTNQLPAHHGGARPRPPHQRQGRVGLSARR